MISGVDYSSGHPGGAALKAAGMKFAARYVSTPGNPKNISLAEATDLAAHGVSTVLVWETTANRAGAGRSAGITDAHDAVAQATAAGMPGSRPLYFAVDWDADPAVVVPYFQGVASVLGLGRTRVYGGYKVVRYLLDHNLVSGAWQTAAWSQGKRDPRAAIYQDATGTRINGVACDNDTASTTDYGQWTPGKTPEVNPVADLTPQIADDTKTLRGDLLSVASLTEKDSKGNPAQHPASYYLAHLHFDALAANSKLDALAKATGGAALTDVQVAALGAQLAASPALAETIAELVAEKLAARLAK